MTTPRYLRPTRLPEAGPRRLRIRVMGPVSLVIAATLVFCLTCLLYLLQDAAITTGTARIARLQQELALAQQNGATLAIQADSLQSQSRIEAEATDKYGMQLEQVDHVVWVPIAVLKPVLAARTPAATSRQAAVSRAPSHGALPGWWQAAGQALAALFR